MFGDVSMEAYGAVRYITGEHGSSFVFSRAGVAPMKKLSLPQLELAATTMAVRLAKYILVTFAEEIHLSNINIWSDSQEGLAWLQSNKNLPVFVHNRVQ